MAGALLTGAALLAAAVPAATAPNPAYAVYAHPQRLVDIGGRRLNLYCLGRGTPTVILDGGLGDDVSGWRTIHAALARTTRVCAYDRAGFGFSDPAPPPRTAAVLAADLGALLRAAGLPPPYVLVGGSLAGLHLRLFADGHLRSIAGMVLVDPSFEHQVARYIAATPAFEASAAQQVATFRSCITALGPGMPSPGSQTYRDCIGDPDPDLPPPAAAALAAREGPDYYRAVLSELEAFNGASADEVDASRRSWGALPLIVLTAGGAPNPDPDTVTRQHLWLAMHERMASLSSRGVHRVIPGARHHIERSNPEAVIAAVNEIIAAARAGAH
jgi:pimeloyl-ACP methyl ester carboxylesterase